MEGIPDIKISNFRDERKIKIEKYFQTFFLLLICQWKLSHRAKVKWKEKYTVGIKLLSSRL